MFESRPAVCVKIRIDMQKLKDELFDMANLLGSDDHTSDEEQVIDDTHYDEYDTRHYDDDGQYFRSEFGCLCYTWGNEYHCYSERSRAGEAKPFWLMMG